MTEPSRTMRVRDIMTRDVITLVASTSMADAARSVSLR